MIHHISRLPLDYTHGATVFVFGDLQWGAQGFVQEAWQEFRSKFKSTKNAWALGLGDYNDFVRTKVRGQLKAVISQDDSIRAQVDDQVRRNQDKLLDEMACLEGRLLGLHEGHHTWEFADRSKSDQRIASALKAPFLGWVASTRLVLEPKRNGDAKPSTYVYTIVSTHGNANARRTAGMTGWMENNLVGGFDANQYIMGHSCKSAAWVPNARKAVRRIGPAGLDETIPRCLQVGGFHQGYTNGWESGYVERNGFAPQALGWGVIHFSRSKSAAVTEERGLSRGSWSLQVTQYSQIWEPPKKD